MYTVQHVIPLLYTNSWHFVYQGRQEFHDFNTTDVISSNISGAIYIVHFDKRGRICSNYYTFEGG